MGETYPADRTDSATIASITTSAMADPRFCSTSKAVSMLGEVLNGCDRPRTSQGSRERQLEMIK
jgi:hypothetical protein